MAWRLALSIPAIMVVKRIVSPAPPYTLRVVLLAYDGMNLLDLAGPLQALTTTNRGAPRGAPARYETIVASALGAQSLASAALPVVTVATASLMHVPIDTLIAPGGCVDENYDVEPALCDFISLRQIGAPALLGLPGGLSSGRSGAIRRPAGRDALGMARQAKTPTSNAGSRRGQHLHSRR